MGTRSSVHRILLLSLLIVAGGGVSVLLVAAISKRSRNTCKGIEVKITGTEGNDFLDRQEVLNMLSKAGGASPAGRKIASMDLQAMETAVRRSPWVKDADLFFDNNGVLRVNVEEREPVARIFTKEGDSFYIDSSGRQLPLSDRMVLKLPVFTNFPAGKKLLQGKDSLLLQEVKHLSRFIRKNPLWLRQVAQVDITPAGTFELVPVIGDHIIVLGNADDCEAKFRRLLLFYRQVASKKGFGVYSIVNVEFNGQVVATRKGPTGKIDSLQAVRNVQRLIDASHRAAFDSAVSTTVDKNIAANERTDTTLSRSEKTDSSSLARPVPPRSALSKTSTAPSQGGKPPPSRKPKKR